MKLRITYVYKKDNGRLYGRSEVVDLRKDYYYKHLDPDSIVVFKCEFA